MGNSQFEGKIMTEPGDSWIKRLFIKESKLHPFWRSVFYLPAWLLAAGFGQLPALMIYVGYLSAHQRDMAVVMAKLLDIANWPLSIGIGVFLGEVLLLLSATFIFVRFLDRRPFASFGFALSQGWGGEVGLGLALGIGMIGGIFLIEWATGLVVLEGLHTGAELGIAAPFFILGYLVYFLLQGSSEEIPMRGYLLQSLTEWLGPVGATLITAVGFSLLHVFNFRFANFNPLALINIALFGVVAYAYFITRRLWLPSALHAGWNFALGPVASLPVSGLAYQGLLRTVVHDVGQIFTGGDFGPEGGVLATFALLSGWLIIWLWARRRTPATLPPPASKSQVEGETP
jgi:membrane protease YdiL (CAAX protease family)